MWHTALLRVRKGTAREKVVNKLMKMTMTCTTISTIWTQA
jgi:hypothetical protein